MNKIRQQLVAPIKSKAGFTIIDALLAISIFSVGFLALTATMWSASNTSRTTARADSSVITGQEMVERLSVLPIDHADLASATLFHIAPDEETVEVEWEALNATDTDSDGTPDFTTIAIRVFSQGELRMQSYYRRRVN